MAKAATQTQYCLHCGSPSGADPYCCHACELLATPALAFPQPVQNPYAHYDLPEFRELHLHSNSEYQYHFFAEGLHCTSCVHLLEKLPEYYEGILAAQVFFSRSQVAVSLRPGASLAQVAFVIQELGYQPTLLNPNDDGQSQIEKENRQFLKRIAVAGFCAGNTMLFVIPVYAGLQGQLATIFNWLSFGLFLPVLLYSSVPFYKGAWVSLKYRSINVDLPIVIAMLTGFILSTVNLIRGDGAIYFDSTASFLFLILSSRYLVKRLQQNYLSPFKIRSFFQGENYQRKVQQQIEIIPKAHVKIGDILVMKPGQCLPSDAVLLSTRATVDMSLFNGESLPRVFSQGMELFAGTQVMHTPIEVRLIKSYEDSRLGLLLKELGQGAILKSHFVALTDRWAQRLIVSVFAIAALFFVIYAPINLSEAWNRCLALIVLACPCALAFGSPLTFGLALKAAQKKGLLIKDATSLERALTVKNVFFDKTGTLTEGQLHLSHSSPAIVSPQLQRIILALEVGSTHPVAFAIRAAWSQLENLPEVQNKEEILGRGVQGLVEGHQYEVRALAESIHDAELAVEVLKNGSVVCRLYFSDELRTDSAAVVAELKEQGLNCFLLSGDKKNRVLQSARLCGVDEKNVWAELFPEDKKSILEKYQGTCMIGDGANDALSLQAADIGIAVKGSVDLSLQNADIYFTRGGLTPFLDLLRLARRSRQVLLRNLILSLIYNVAGGILALMGLIDPMLAAILMPVSSLAIVISTLWGFR